MSDRYKKWAILLPKAKELIASGKTPNEAADELKVSRQYLGHKLRADKKQEVKAAKASSPRPYKAFPIPVDDSPFELKGSPEQVAKFLGEISRQFGGHQ